MVLVSIMLIYNLFDTDQHIEITDIVIETSNISCIDMLGELDYSNTYNMVFSPDGSDLAISSQDGISIIDMTTGTQKYFFRHISDNSTSSFEEVNNIAFSSDGNSLMSSSHHIDNPNIGSMQLWDINTGERSALLVRNRSISNISISTENLFFGYTHITENFDIDLYVLNFGNGQELLSREDIGRIGSLQFAFDDSLLYLVDDGIQIIDIRNPQNEITVDLGNQSNTQFYSSHDNSLVAITNEGTLTIIESNHQSRSWLSHSARITDVTFNNTNSIVATSGDRVEPTIKLWSILDGGLLYELDGHTNVISGISFNPLNDLLASSSWDGTVRIWSGDTGENLRILEPEIGFILDVAFSPIGNLVAIQGESAIQLWGCSNP